MRNKYIQKLMQNNRFRLLITTGLGSSWNFIYAIFQFVLAAWSQSFWFLTMGIYYILICFMRALALLLHSKEKTENVNSIVLKQSGLMMFCLAFVFTGIICLSIAEKRNSSYHIAIALVVALYTFYGVVTAIINLIKLIKENTVQTVILGNVSMANALGSLFSLECMMLGTFGNPADRFTRIMEAVSGAVIVILLLILGGNLMIMSFRNTREN